MVAKRGLTQLKEKPNSLLDMREEEQGLKHCGMLLGGDEPKRERVQKRNH